MMDPALATTEITSISSRRQLVGIQRPNQDRFIPSSVVVKVSCVHIEQVRHG